MRMSASTGTAQALREQLALLDQIQRKEAEVFAPTRDTFAGAGNEDAAFDRRFSASFRKKLDELRAGRAAETRGLASTRGTARDIRGVLELATGNVSLGNVKDLAEVTEGVAGHFGAKTVAKYAGFAVGAIGALGGAGALAAGVREAAFAIMERAASNKALEVEQKARIQIMRAFTDPFLESEAQREARTRRISPILERGLQIHGKNSDRISHWSSYSDLPDNTFSEWEGEAKYRSMFAKELVELDKGGKRAAEALQRQVKNGVPTSGEAWRGRFEEGKIGQRVEALLEAGADARELLHALNTAAQELRDVKKRNAEAEEMFTRWGEQETAGVRNSVMWAQKNARDRAVEEMQLTRYNDWSQF